MPFSQSHLLEKVWAQKYRKEGAEGEMGDAPQVAYSRNDRVPVKYRLLGLTPARPHETQNWDPRIYLLSKLAQVKVILEV